MLRVLVPRRLRDGRSCSSCLHSRRRGVKLYCEVWGVPASRKCEYWRERK